MAVETCELFLAGTALKSSGIQMSWEDSRLLTIVVCRAFILLLSYVCICFSAALSKFQDCIMGLVEDFPENPFVPTLRWAATQLTPLRLSCGHNPIKLGSTLSVSHNKNQKSSFSDSSAFSRSSLEQSRIVFISGSGGSITQTSSFGGASAQKDVNFSIHGEIGGDLLGAEVRVNYEKHTLDSSSVSQTPQSLPLGSCGQHLIAFVEYLCKLQKLFHRW